MDEKELKHYGTPRHSGRYPWGSGDNPYQHSGTFLSRIDSLKNQGLNEKEIAESFGLNTSQLRIQKALAREAIRTEEVAKVKSLRANGYSLNAIAKEMGFKNDSSVRTLLNKESEARMNAARKTADFLKEQINKKGMIDVGTGVERELGVSSTKLNQALYILELEGYPTYGGGVPQVTNPGKQTNLKVVCPPGTEHKEIYNFDKINTVTEYQSRDGGDTFDKFEYPKSMDSKRLKIRYAEEGGLQKDGVVEIRRGVDDLSLGNSHYAQVRILVDGKKYIKGMAVYSDDMPDGVDVIFNTNKKKGTPKLDVLKNIKDDPENPFGSLIKAGGQYKYIDKNGKEQLGLINKRAEEGDWADWSDKLPSQFLSKQPISLIKKQLKLTAADKVAEFDEICSLTNPTVKKTLLASFADDCDAAAVHLKAASLPRQKYQVLLPLTSIRDNEVYAPNYNNGEQVALIRYPHGGTFEIPILTVNNKIPEAKKVIGVNSKDAIGINSKVAERLSGADFDGDAVTVIPTGGKIKITSTPALQGLEGFDPKLEYGGKPKGTFKAMKNTQTEMGIISNLITDMTLKGATSDELARAVRHSMVVIDAEKHGLDYKQSEADNNITALKKKYQSHLDDNGYGGASTLISKAKSTEYVLKRKGSPKIDKDTGEKIYNEVKETYVDKNGKTQYRTIKSTKMAEAKDAMDLVSDFKNAKEVAYAEYANAMKTLGNKARKEMISTKEIERSPSAAITYAKEVASLDSKLNIALKNKPKERKAQTIANATIKAKQQEYPNMSKEELKKAKQMALNDARNQVGADSKGSKIVIDDKEWEAIQSGAISKTKLSQILSNTNIDDVRQRATPRTTTKLSNAKISKIAAMNSSGYTIAEIAKALGISTSTVHKYL